MEKKGSRAVEAAKNALIKSEALSERAKARRKGARDDSNERRVTLHALLESSYESEYQQYREAMPATVSAGASEEEIRANFMRDHSRRIGRVVKAKEIPSVPVLELPEESGSEHD